MAQIATFVSNVESWFNSKFGWFFTNGNKQRRIQNDRTDNNRMIE